MADKLDRQWSNIRKRSVGCTDTKSIIQLWRATSGRLFKQQDINRMQLSDIIAQERVVSSLEGAGKNSMEPTAEFIAEESQMDSEDIYRA